MESLFGASIDLLYKVFAAVSGLALLSIIFVAISNRMMLRLGVRNVTKTPLQSGLIVIGLMLSTTIIAASLGVGDTVTHSIRKVVLDSSLYVDEVIKPKGSDYNVDAYISQSDAEKIRGIALQSEYVDGVIFSVETVVPVVNMTNSRTEARMILRGYGVDDQPVFGDLTTLNGDVAYLADLLVGELYINEVSAEKLGAKSGDQLNLVTSAGSVTYKLKDVLMNGGLASGGSTSVGLMPLGELQRILSRDGEIDEIGISNLGGVENSIEHSEQVTKFLRLQLVDRSIAEKIFLLLHDEEPVKALKKKYDDPRISEDVKIDIDKVISELTKPEMGDEFIDLIGDKSTIATIQSAVKSIRDGEISSQINFLYRSVSKFEVINQKSDLLKFAETIGSGITTFLSIFGSFSIVVGILLIFLVMILLAAARKTEMGMSRAIGFKRSHLIRIFTLEGAIYAVISALIGTILGIAISYTLVELLRRVIGVDEFPIFFSVSWKSLVITWGAGFTLTLVTVLISSYRISRLNIVSAIRGLDEEFSDTNLISWKVKTVELACSFIAPFSYLYITIKSKKKSTVTGATVGFFARLLPPVWGGIALYRLLTFIAPVLLQGWPMIICGGILAYWGAVSQNSTAYFSLGSYLLIIGIGLSFRTVLRILKCRKTLASRISATLEGILLLLFSGLPFDTFESITGVLDSSPAIFVLGGVAMVGSSAWIIMHNTPVIIWVLNLLFGNIPGLRAVLKTAIAYPISATFRTGLTISMFALIILTMMIIAVLNNTFSVRHIDPDRITGGFDIVATIPGEYPIDDFRGRINSSDILDDKDFKSTVGSVEVPSLARQLDYGNKIFKPLAIRAMDASYFETSKIQFSHYDPLYGNTPQEIWNSLAGDANLSVVNSAALATDDPFAPERPGFVIEDFRNSTESDAWKAIAIQIRPAWGGEQILERKIIAIIDQAAESLNAFDNMTYLITDESIRVQLLGSSIPYDTYHIELADDIDRAANFSSTEEIVSLLETEFLNNGLDADSTEQLIKDSQSSEQAFNRLFQGFMSLGLVVGVAAIGVLSVRAVVERRQSIGMLRAIGYRSAMIQGQFLAEALFVTLMGVALGVALGTLTSWNIYQDVSKEVKGLVFSVPWSTVLIIVGVTSAFALLSAYLPARQASKIYPAEALRYQR